MCRVGESILHQDYEIEGLQRGLQLRRGGILGERIRPFNPGHRDGRVLLSGEDVSAAIRTPEISMGASEVSAHAPVREAMVALQRKMGEEGGVVLEGRDTGTVVFPDADAKFFLDAHAAVRALRRYREWGAEEGKIFEEVWRDVLRRDIQDSTRQHSPLRMAEGAIYIDSTILTVEEVVEEMLRNLFLPATRKARDGDP